MADVFISYSSQHRELTEALAALLAREGYTVWWDHALESWQSFQAEIDREIAAARVIVVIWSKGAADSLYVKAEANKAIAARKLVNVRAPGFPHSAIPTPYNAMHIDEPSLDEPHRLLRSIRSVWSGKPYTITNKPLHEHYYETFDVSLFDPKREGRIPNPERLAPSELLQARWEVVPYMDTALGLAAEMEAWCEDTSRATAGRLVHGAGGFGKTRLMVEVAKRLRAKDWLAGFVQPMAVAGDVQEARQRKQAFEQLFAYGDEPGVLLVYDYAEGRQDEVADVVKLLANRKADRPVRLVLLSRGDAWWGAFHDQRPGARAVFHAVGQKLGDVRCVADLPPGQPRLDLFVETVRSFKPVMEAMASAGRFPGFDPHRTPMPVLTERLERMQSHEDYARPLAIQMEALLYLASASPAPGQTSTADLLREVLHLEQVNWAKLLGDEPKPLPRDPDRARDIARGVAQVTAVQGVNGGKPLIELLKADRFYGDERKADVKVDPVRRDITRLYGRADGGVAHLEPDLIGEHLVAGTTDPELIDGCLAWIAAQPAAERATLYEQLLTVLQRASQPVHGPEAAKAAALLDHLIARHGGTLGEAMVKVMGDTPGALFDRLDAKVETLDAETLGAVNFALPVQNLPWMEFSLRVAERHADLARKLSAAADAAALPAEARAQVQNRLAAALGTLGIRLSNLGRREDALQASQEAVNIRRALAKDRPDAFLPDLATSLNNLGAMLSNLGRREDALQASQEAVNIRRALAKDRPDAFLPDLAMSLNNLGRDLSNLGRREDALQASQEAVDIYRALAKDRPDAFLPDLAMSLNNLGRDLSNLGRREDALQASQEAVDIYRALAKDRPDAFLPDLASSLNNLGIRLSNLGRREDALQASQEAVNIRRALAKDRPDAFLPDLATSLNNLGAMLSNLGRREDALQASQEAVNIRRALAKDRPDAFLPDLAMSLNNLGIRLSNLGRREDALQASQEAVDIRRALAKDRPDAFLPDLAMSLNNLGGDLSNLGRREDALQASQEAVDIYRALAKDRPDAFLPDLASSLNNLGIRLSNLGRREDALQASQEAVDIYRALAKDRPDAFLPDLASSLNNLGIRLSNLGRREDALQASQEAVDIYRALAKDRPDAFLPNLAMSLNNLGGDLSNLGRREDALQASQEAVDIYRALAKDRPDAFLPDLATSLNNLGIRLSNLGRREDALQASQEAVDIHRALAKDRPDAFLPDLAMSLGALSQTLVGAERFAEAAAAAREGLEVIAPFAEALPQAFGSLAGALARAHIEASEKARTETDDALLERVAKALGRGS